MNFPPPSTLCVFFNPVQGKRGSEDLIEACQYGHIKRAMELLDHGENVNYQDWVKKHPNSYFNSNWG